MNIKKFSNLFIALALVASMFCLPFAAYATGADASGSDTTSTAAPADPGAADQTTTAPAVTEAPSVETVVVTSYAPVLDENGAPVKDENGVEVTTVITYYETVPVTTAPAETTAPATPENLVFYPDAGSVFGVISIQKGDNGWEAVSGDFYEDPEKAPVYVAIEPGKRDLHGTVTVEFDDDDGWVVTKADFYASKLMVVPVVIITFLVTLALMVAINILIIKLRKSSNK